MHKPEIESLLQEVGQAKAEWAKAITRFNDDVEKILKRLLYEAAHQRMSPEQVAEKVGVTPTRVRALMRKFGLNPRDGKNLLSKQAAAALHSNAELMGISPKEMDLMSPLAYLPMGQQLKDSLLDRSVSKVTDLDEVSGNEDDL